MSDITSNYKACRLFLHSVPTLVPTQGVADIAAGDQVAMLLEVFHGIGVDARAGEPFTMRAPERISAVQVELDYCRVQQRDSYPIAQVPVHNFLGT